MYNKFFTLKAKEKKRMKKLNKWIAGIVVYDACHNHGCRTGCDGSEGR